MYTSSDAAITWSTVFAAPFALTGSATDPNGDAMTFAWEQNDRGGNAGSSLLGNTKTDGPLFAMFPILGQISESDTLL